jgi:hypothetical protein
MASVRMPNKLNVTYCELAKLACKSTILKVACSPQICLCLFIYFAILSEIHA